MGNAMEQEKYPSADDLLKETNFLISLPQVCLQLREVMATPLHSRRQIIDIIIYEPALTTRILKIVNSAYYGIAHPVRDISHALSILGEQELNNLVIVTSIVKSMKSVGSRMNISCHWRASVFSAVMSRNLARHCKYSDERMEEFFISGLLLNIGKLLLYCCEPELLEVVESGMLRSEQPDFEIENEQLGFDHADVGAAMARSWNFSEQLTDSVADHHNSFSRKSSTEQCIAILSAYISDQLDFKFPKQISLDDLALYKAGLMDKLQLSEELFCGLVNKSYEDYLLAFEAFCGGQQ